MRILELSLFLIVFFVMLPILALGGVFLILKEPSAITQNVSVLIEKHHLAYKENTAVLMVDNSHANVSIETTHKGGMVAPQKILLDVPFTSQAPFGEWKNPVFQNGCEEAAVLMATYWLNGKTITRTIAEEEIQKITALEKNMYADVPNLSATDTAHLLVNYAQYQDVVVYENITRFDILRELNKKNLIIVPVNGQMLKSPYYTPPGPSEHILLVVGYNPFTKEFIVHDPGTYRGKGLHVSQEILERALNNYPTGQGESLRSSQKIMIVVRARML